MRAFLAFAVGSRINAILVATGLAVLSVCLTVGVVVFPPLFLAGVVAYMASVAIVGLAVLKFGIVEGLLIMLGPTLFWCLPMLIPAEEGMSNSLLALPGIMAVLGVFLPVLVMVELLRRTRSQAVAFGAGAVLLMAVAVLFHLVGFDPVKWLVFDMLPAMRGSMPEAQSQAMAAPQVLPELTDRQSSLLMGRFIANSLLGLIVCVSLARWWHGILDNPGGFGTEFRSLRFGRRVGYAALVLMALANFLDGWFADLSLKLLPSVLLLLLLQGLAIAHAIVKERKAGRQWLTAMYVLLGLSFFNPLPALAVVITGLLDPWIGFRERWARS